MGHKVPASKKGYLELVRAFADKVEKEYRESDAITGQLSEQKEKIGVLELKVHLLTDNSVAVSDLRMQLAALETRNAILEESFANMNKSLSSMTRRHGALRIGLDPGCPAIGRVEHVIQEFKDKDCKWTSLLVRAQSTSYPDSVNTVLADAQIKGIYAGGLCVRASNNMPSLHIGNDGSENDRGVTRRHPARMAMM